MATGDNGEEAEAAEAGRCRRKQAPKGEQLSQSGSRVREARFVTSKLQLKQDQVHDRQMEDMKFKRQLPDEAPFKSNRLNFKLHPIGSSNETTPGGKLNQEGAEIRFSEDSINSPEIVRERENFDNSRCRGLRDDNSSKSFCKNDGFGVELAEVSCCDRPDNERAQNSLQGAESSRNLFRKRKRKLEGSGASSGLGRERVRIRLATSSELNMRPNWRQLIVLSFLTILFTSLLANFNHFLLRPEKCLLVNTCHALTIESKQDSNSSQAQKIDFQRGPKVAPLGQWQRKNSTHSLDPARPKQFGPTLLYHFKPSAASAPASQTGAGPTTSTTAASVGSLSAPTAAPAGSTTTSSTTTNSPGGAGFSPIQVAPQANDSASWPSFQSSRFSFKPLGAGQPLAAADSLDNGYRISPAAYLNSFQVGHTMAERTQLASSQVRPNSGDNDETVLEDGSNQVGRIKSILTNREDRLAGPEAQNNSSTSFGADSAKQHQAANLTGSRMADDLGAPSASANAKPNLGAETFAQAEPNSGSGSGWTVATGGELGRQPKSLVGEKWAQKNLPNQAKGLPDAPESSAQGTSEFPFRQEEQHSQRQRQNSLPHGLIHSAVREALNDLLAGSQGPQLQRNPVSENIYTSASAYNPLVLRPAAILSASDNKFSGHEALRLHDASQVPLISLQQYQNLLNSGAAQGRPAQLVQEGQRQFLLPTASASAPSISLPPLSHFLVPRNPFRLFSSHSTPIVTKYRPQLVKSQSSGAGKQAAGWLHLGRQQQPSLQSHLDSTGSGGFIMQSASTSNPVNDNQAKYATGNGLGFGLDLDTNTNLYANPHSAEQLEQLIKAASKATGVRQPILPAIVQAPTGASFPGFYIPAIESESDETALMNHRHNGELASASTLNSAPAGGQLVSKIPGTDYILHPDEVRSMISIGEIAWRQQQQQESSASHQHDQRQQPQQPLGSASNQNNRKVRNNYMQENHMENVRDFAYVDAAAAGWGPRNKGQIQAAASQEQATNSSFGSPRHQAAIDPAELELHLNRHFNNRASFSAFPAIIRVNDQDYVHWPLIKLSGSQHEQQQQFDGDQKRTNFMEESRKVSTTYNGQANANLENKNRQLYALMQNFNSNNRDQNRFKSAPVHPVYQELQAIRRPQESRAQPVQNGKGEGDSEFAPVRLVTQLTPNEIRQVEDSIIEALIMASTLQQQRHSASQQVKGAKQSKQLQQASSSNQINQFQSPWVPQGSHQPKTSIFNGFFSKRRRRNSSNNNNGAGNSGNKQQANQLSVSSSNKAAQIISMVPLINVSGLIPSEETSLVSLAVSPIALKQRPVPSLPILMADQETNRPNLLLPDNLSNAFMSAEATVQRPSILRAPQQVIRANGRGPAEATSGGENEQLAFGSRVSAQTRFNGLPQSRPHQQYQATSALRPTMSNLLPPANSLEIIGDKALAASSASNNHEINLSGNNWRPRGAKFERQEVNRQINVDWPTMVSDADYFPQPNGERDRPDGQARASSLKLAESRQASNSGGSGNRLVTGAQRRWPAARAQLLPVRGGQRQPDASQAFVGSQLKLQFAQDYQAREGVPIYNNNVRIAGALDRQRSNVNQMESTRVVSGSAKPENEDERSNYENEDEDSADESSIKVTFVGGRKNETQSNPRESLPFADSSKGAKFNDIPLKNEAK